MWKIRLNNIFLQTAPMVNDNLLASLPNTIAVVTVLGYMLWFFMKLTGKQQERFDAIIREKDTLHAVQLEKIERERKEERTQAEARYDKVVEEKTQLTKYVSDALNDVTNALNKNINAMEQNKSQK